MTLHGPTTISSDDLRRILEVIVHARVSSKGIRIEPLGGNIACAHIELPDTLLEQIKSVYDAVNIRSGITIVDFWSATEDTETLSLTSENDAIKDAIEYYVDTDTPIPTTVRIYGHARVPIAREELGRPTSPLELVLEQLDEDYGDPENATEPSASMKDAERVFLDAVHKAYVPWACTIVCTKDINTAEWIGRFGDEEAKAALAKQVNDGS